MKIHLAAVYPVARRVLAEDPSNRVSVYALSLPFDTSRPALFPHPFDLSRTDGSQRTQDAVGG